MSFSEAVDIRAACADDTAAIESLAGRNDLLGDGITPPEFSRKLQWLYHGTPYGARLQLVGLNKNAITAHYGAMPIPFRYKGSMLVGGLASNLVVDKECRKDGPFFSLQKRFLKDYPTLGYSFVFGAVTRPGVLEPHLRMGWKKVGELPVFIRPMRSAACLREKIGSHLVSSLFTPLCWIGDWVARLAFLPAQTSPAVVEVSRFDDSFEELFQRWMECHPFCAYRTEKFLNWRYVDVPDRRYRIFAARVQGKPVGFMVLREMEMKQLKTLAIVDLVSLPGEKATFEALLRNAILEGYKSKVDAMAVALNPFHEQVHWLKRWGFVKGPHTFTLIVHVPKGSEFQIDSNVVRLWPISWLEHDYV